MVYDVTPADSVDALQIPPPVQKTSGLLAETLPHHLVFGGACGVAKAFPEITHPRVMFS